MSAHSKKESKAKAQTTSAEDSSGNTLKKPSKKPLNNSAKNTSNGKLESRKGQSCSAQEASGMTLYILM